MDLPNQVWLGGSQSNLKPVVASEVLEKCLDQQGIPKNVMLGTKNIKIGPLWPNLALGRSKLPYSLGKLKWVRKG